MVHGRLLFSRRQRGAGGAASGRRPTPPRATHRSPPLPAPGPGAPQVPAALLDWAPRSSPPAPRPPQVPARPERAPPWQQLGPPVPREEHGGRHSARTSGGGRGPAWGRADAHLPAAKRTRGAYRARPAALLPRHLGPPPGSGFAFVPPPGSCLSRGEGEGEGRQESFRRLHPPPLCSWERGGSRAAAPPRGLRAPGAPGRRGAGRGGAERGPRPERADAAVGAVPGAPARKPACSKMVGFGLLYFFFCSLHFKEQKKKPNPSRHFICISQDPEPGHSGLRGGRQLWAPHPTTGLVGRALLLGPKPGLWSGFQPEHNQSEVNC